MSRLFDGSNDIMTYALPVGGNPGPVNYAFGTQLIVAQFVTTTGNGGWASLIEMENAAGTIVLAGIGRDSGGALYYSDGNTLARSSEAGTGTNFTIGTGDSWAIYAITKPTGTASVSFHKIPIGGSRTSITRTATSLNSTSLASGRIHIGGNDDFGNIRVAAAAVMPSVVLTTTQLDAIATAKTTQSIIDVAGANGWVVDDGDGLTNNLVANNTNRSAIEGTADDGSDPAGWTYFGVGTTYTKAGTGIVGP